MRKGFKGFMNKVFKVVWSKSKECYVVVPEIAKNNSGKKKVLASVLAGLAVAGAMGGIAPQQAMAGYDTGNSHVNIWADTNPKSNGQNYNVGQNSIVVGYQNTTDNVAGHDGKVAIGAKNTSTNNASTAVGNENKATGGAATAVGAGNTASGKASVALGNVNNADAKAAIAIGTYNNVNYTKGSWQTTPKHAGEYSTVVGNYSSATGTSASAMGVYTNATGAGSFAAGYNNNANGQNSVAIGSENTSHVADTVTLGQFNNAKTMGGISIGKNNLTDSSNDGRNAANTRDENSQIAIGRDNVATHLDTIAIGRETTASGSGSTVVGARAEASGDNSIAIGQSGKGSPKVIASGVNSIAIGMQSQATGEAAIAEGAGSRAGGKYGVALGRTTKANAEAATALGNAAEANIANGVALGASSVTTTDKGVLGYNPSDPHDRKYKNLKGNVQTATTAAVSIGNGETLTRQLTGLAAGTADTDAVNVAQLKNVGVAVAGNTGKSDFLADGGRLNVIGTGRVSTVAAHEGEKDSKITVGFDDKGMVKAGKNVKVDEVTVNGRTTYTINAADAAAKYDFLTNAKANGGKLDGTATATKVESGQTVTYAAGKNLTVKQDINQSAGEQTYTYSLDKDLKEITSITNNGGTTMNFGPNNISITGGNLDLGGNNITNLKSGGDTINNAANIGDVIRISKANDLHIAPTAGTNNNVAEYTVDANKKVTLTYQDGNGNTVTGPKAVIDLSGLKTGDMSSFNVKSSATEGKVAQGSAGVQEIRDGKTVEMQAGKNMTIKQTNNNGNAAVEFSLNKNVDLTPDGSLKIGDTNITDNGLTINNGPSITKTGINAGDLNITNVKAGVNDNDAVNVSQLKKVRADERHIKPGEYAVDNNGKVTMTYLDGNNKDVANETAVITGIAKQDLSNINKGGETVIQNLAKKSIDMENGKNTKVSNREINGVKTFKVDVEGDLNDITSITNKAGDGKVVFGGNQTVNVAGDHNINLNAKVGDITGLTNVTLDAPDFAKKGRAATEEQLSIVNNGFNNTVGLTGNTGATDLQKLNQAGGLSFGVIGANNGQYIKTTASGSNVAVDLSDEAKGKLNSTVVVEGKNAAKVTSNVIKNADGSTKTVYTVDVNNVKPTAASTEKVQAKADVAGSSDKNIAKVAPKAGENFGDAGATYEVNVSRNDVKDAAREAITVNTSNTTNNPITVTPVQDETNHNTTYTVTFDGDKAAKQIPLTYKANGQNAQTVTLDKGLNFTNGSNTTASVAADGVVKYDLNNNIDLTPNGSLKIGDTILNNGGLTITGGPSVTKTGINAGNLNITNVKAGVNDTDAVNVKQLKDARTVVTSNDNSVTVNKTENGNQVTYDLHVAPGAAQSVWNVKSTGNTTADSETAAKTISDGKTVEMAAGKNLTVKQTSNNDGAKVEFDLANDIKIGKDGKDGVDGKIGVNGKDGSSVVINGKDGSIGLNGKDGKDGLTMKGEKGADGVTRIVYEDHDNNKHEVATLDDGLRFDANSGGEKKNKLGSKVTVKGTGAKADSEYDSSNIKTSITQGADGNSEINIGLAKDLNNINTIKNGGPATFTIGGNEFKFDGGNVNMGGNNITNLKSGIVNNNSTDDTNGANIGDVKTISKANDLHIAPTTSNRQGETTTSYAYDTASKSVTLKYNDGNGANQAGTIAKIDLSGLADQIKDGYSFSTDAKGNVVGNHAVTAVGNGKTVSYAAGDNLTIAQHIDNATGEQTYTYALSNDIKIGKDGKDGIDGKIGVNGKDGSSVVINGKDGSIGLNGKDGKDGLTMKGEKGADGVTRIVYEDNTNNKHEVATLDDGLRFDANSGGEKKNKLGSKVTVKGTGTKADSEYDSSNIKTSITQGADGNSEINIGLAKDLNNINTIKNGGNATFTIGGDNFAFNGGNVSLGGNNITNLKSGVVNNNDTDNTNAANIGDVKNISKANDIHVKDKTYTVNADKTVTLEYVDGNDNTINKTAKIDLSNLPTGDKAAVESVVKKSAAAGDTNIADITVADGKQTGDANAKYEVNVSRNAVKDAAREAVTVNTTNTTNNPITVTPVQDETNHNTTYTVTFDGNKAATQIPLTYKANGQNAQTVTLDKGLNFTNGRNTTASVDAEGVVKYDVNKDLVNINSISNTTNGPKMEFGPNSINIINGPINMGDQNITNLKSGGDVINNAANIGDVKRISKENDLHIAPTTSNRQGETTTSYAYDAASKSVTLKYNDGNGATQAGTIAKIDLSGLADQIKDGYSFSTDAKGNVVGNHAVTAVANGKTVSYAAGDNLTVKQDIDATTGEHTYTYALSNDIKVGKDGKDGIDGKIGVNGKDGSSVVINGKDGSIGLNGKDGKDGLTIRGEKGQDGVDGKNGTNGITRIVYEDHNNDKHEVATLDDGMKYAGDDAQGTDKSKVIAKKLNETMDVVGGADKSKLTDNNIGVNNVDGKLKVQLSKEVNLTPSGSLTIGDTVVNNNGLTISGGPSITKTGINAGNKTIVNVDAGVNDTDAVNVQQLKKAKTEVKAGNNVTVDTTYGTDGHTIYTVNANDVALGDAVLKYSANGTNTQSVKLSQGLNFVDGNYTSASVDANGQVKYDVTIGKVKDGVDGKPGVDGKDGIATVKTVVDTINNSGWKGDVTGNTVNNHTATIVKPGTTVNFGAGKNLTVEQIVDKVTGDHTYNYALSDDIKVGKDGKDGVDGKIGVNGKDGSSVVINGKDGSIGLNGKDGKDGLTMKAKDGQPGVNGKDGITRIVYEDNSKNTHEVATLDDGMKYAGDDAQGTDKSKVIAKKLNQTMDIVGGANSTKLTDNNIGVNNVDGKLKVQLAQNIDLTPAGSLTIGGTSITDNGLVINQGPSITKGGINAGNKTIVNVAPGVNGTDAVNVNQLNSARTEVEEGDNVTVTSRTGANGQTIYKVSATGVNLGDAELKYSANGTNTQSVKLSKGLNFVDGNYTSASVDANGQVKYDVNLGNIKQGTDGKPGVDGKDGIATVKTVVDTINNSGWKANATGNVVGTSTATIVKPGSTVNYGAGKNLNVKQTVNGEEQTYEFALDKDLKELNSVQTNTIHLGSPTSHTTINYNAGNDRIEYTTKNGTKQVANLDDIWTIQANGTDVKPVGGKVNVVGGDHIKVSTDAAGKMTISADGVGTMNGFNVKSTGNTTNDSDKTAKNITDGKTVEFSGGKNLTVKQTNTADGAKVEFTLNNNIDLTPNGSVTIGDTVVNNDGLTITGGPTITKNNVDMGGQQIHNVKSGGDVDSNGANIGDIKRISKANDTRIKDGNYEVSQNGTVEMTYVDGSGKQLVDEHGNPVKATISGIARQDLSNITNEGKKVITGLGTIVKAGQNVSVDEATDNATGQKTYTVNADLSGAKVYAGVGTDGSGVAKGLKNPAKVEKGTQYIAGDNMVVERKPVEGDDKLDNSITYSLAHDLTEINSISNGGATLRINSNPGGNKYDRDTAVTPAFEVHGGNLSMTGNRIVNLAPGIDGTDGVNVNQLRDSLTTVKSTDGTVRVTDLSTDPNKHEYDLHVNPAADPRVDKLGEEIGHVGAQSAALSALKPIQYDPMEPTQIMAGYGNYRGNSALALGVAHYKNESTMFHAGVSWAGGNGHMMANAGVTWKVGNRDSEAAVADHYRKGPISSTYAMQTEVASMKAQNAGLKGEVSDLKAENEQIKAQNAGLQSEVDQLKAQMAAMMAKLGM